MIDLNYDEMEVIYNFIGVANWYEQRNLLCRTYSDNALEKKNEILLRAFNKIGGEIGKDKE